ncbi:MAG: toll/interleukin-1 receptor domain-containing protein [Planctomycetes bacterium]|nr:toll/interleukin-1 receptor domain-containing protein [Planctomycetota bacterium]
MADDFRYDVFLSHSSKDTAVVRDVAERLRGDGLRVWFDEWEIPSEAPLAHRMGEGSRGEDRGRAGALPRARTLDVGAGVRLRLGAVGGRHVLSFATR